jgi:hypothetical protein
VSSSPSLRRWAIDARSLSPRSKRTTVSFARSSQHWAFKLKKLQNLSSAFALKSVAVPNLLKGK